MNIDRMKEIKYYFPHNNFSNIVGDFNSKIDEVLDNFEIKRAAR